MAHFPQLTRTQLWSAAAVLDPSIIGWAGSRDIPLSLARNGKVAKRSREICRDLTVGDIPSALGNVTVLSSPIMCTVSGTPSKIVCLKTGAHRQSYHLLERSLGPFACPHA